MNIRKSDYLLVRLAESAATLLHRLGNLESAWLRNRMRTIPIESPVFITGLARSGTTILLEELAKTPGVGTHRYRDFPFVMTPYFWGKFFDRFGVPQSAVERPHQDRIRITAESPEAFEEPIWQFFFPHLHAADALHLLRGDRRSKDFDDFFADHVRKILFIRQARRYLSKENYNVARIEYLAKLFPDAKFVIPVRHPFTHVQSLVRQHTLFSHYSQLDPRVKHCLTAAGHYEFGPQRVPIRLSGQAGDRIRSAWDHGDDDLGYAIQWAEIYRYVDLLRSKTEAGAPRILVVRYEDFCSQPRDLMARIVDHTGLGTAAGRDPQAFDHISPSCHDASAPPREFRTKVWRETEAIATRFGY